MCTTTTYQSNDHYFGRNLDLDQTYHEQVVITPRNVELNMKCEKSLKSHYEMIGMATVRDQYPLYYDATNEKGLSMAGLNFMGNAYYDSHQKDKRNITPFELIPWILGRCATVQEAKHELLNLNLVNIPFSDELPLTPLHWLLSDDSGSITIESTQQTKLKIYAFHFAQAATSLLTKTLNDNV